MRNVLLPVPHFEQSRDGACLPACVRMILAFWGDPRPESQIAAQLGTKPFGTPISNVVRLSAWGYVVSSFFIPHLPTNVPNIFSASVHAWAGITAPRS